jgi:putative tryptophan/tyrosine transport system substrate-binding protein
MTPKEFPMISRRCFVLLTVATLSICAAALGAKAEELKRVGVLEATKRPNPFDDLFESRMRDLGWVNGKNVAFVYRATGGVNDTLPMLAKELVAERVDIILTSGTPGSLAARDATKTIPVVFWSVGDPVGVGLVRSLSQPGGNVTGISGITYQLGAKRLELLKEAMPGAKLIGMLLDSADTTAPQVFEALKGGVRSSTVSVEPFYVAHPSDLDPVFRKIKAESVDGVLVQPDGMFWTQRPTIVKLAADLHLPVIYGFREDVDAGGLMSYGADATNMLDNAVVYVDKILRGAKPADLPVQEARKLDLAINLKTAKALGLAIPPSLLARADHVVE